MPDSVAACTCFTAGSTVAAGQTSDFVAADSSGIAIAAGRSKRYCSHRVADCTVVVVVVVVVVAFSTLLAAAGESLASTAEARAGIAAVSAAITGRDCSQDEKCWSRQFAL